MKSPPNSQPRNNHRLLNVILGLLIISIAANVFLLYRAWDYRRGANEWLAKYMGVVEEFGRREVYRDANLSLKSDTTISGRIVFLGTQVTKRWDLPRFFRRGIELPTPFANTIPTLLDG